MYDEEAYAIAQALIDHGAAVDGFEWRDGCGYTPLEYARACGEKRMVDILTG